MNKGSAVCKSNSIRAEKAEEYVLCRISRLLVNDGILKDIVTNMNADKGDKRKPLEA